MSRPRRISPATLFFFALSVILGIALYVKTRPVPADRQKPVETPAEAHLRERERPHPSRPSSRSLDHPLNRSFDSAALPRIAILIDDLGNDQAAVERIAGWRHDVTGAVLPGLSGSARTARILASSGKQVLLHLPMEPKGYPAVRPGPGVVLTSQSNEEIGRTLESDLDSVPGAAGVNNHMGSAATADPRVMRAVAQVLSRRGLFFVDSRTTDSTVAQSAAEQARVPSAARRVFLDDEATEPAIERQLGELLERARAEGSAIAIGHPYPATLSVLERELPRLASGGIRLVKVGELVK